jgi:hypothetical protein
MPSMLISLPSLSYALSLSESTTCTHLGLTQVVPADTRAHKQSGICAHTGHARPCAADVMNAAAAPLQQPQDTAQNVAPQVSSA